MSRLSYSTDLEDLARMAVMTCSAHKFCSPEFYYVGTNQGSTYYLGSLNDFEDLELMLRTIQDWIPSEIQCHVSVKCQDSFHVAVPKCFTKCLQ